MLPTFVSCTPVEKGWSGDQKYCAVTGDGQKVLLRITPREKAAGRERIFELQKQAADMGVRMCEPLAFGLCDEGVYSLQRWVEGEDAENCVPGYGKEKQYALGKDAGAFLRIMHRIPAPPDQQDWETRFNAKMDRKIRMYQACSVQYEGAQHFIRYIEENRHLLKNRPQSFQHGDYHIGNMMVEKDQLVVIDFDRYDFGDPWEEFNRIVWCAQAAPVFAKGMVDGYFDGEVPLLFWRLLALYISSNTLSSVPWAIPFGQEQVDVMLRQAKDVLCWYEDMRRVVPAWYAD